MITRALASVIPGTVHVYTYIHVERPWSYLVIFMYLYLYYRVIYNALQLFWNKTKLFLYNSKQDVDLKRPLLQTILIEIRPHETRGLIFNPNNLIPSIIHVIYGKLFVLHRMSYIPRISRFCHFYKSFQNFWTAIYVWLTPRVGPTSWSSFKIVGPISKQNTVLARTFEPLCLSMATSRALAHTFLERIYFAVLFN